MTDHRDRAAQLREDLENVSSLLEEFQSAERPWAVTQAIAPVTLAIGLEIWHLAPSSMSSCSSGGKGAIQAPCEGCGSGRSDMTGTEPTLQSTVVNCLVIAGVSTAATTFLDPILAASLGVSGVLIALTIRANRLWQRVVFSAAVLATLVPWAWSACRPLDWKLNGSTLEIDLDSGRLREERWFLYRQAWATIEMPPVQLAPQEVAEWRAIYTKSFFWRGQAAAFSGAQTQLIQLRRMFDELPISEAAKRSALQDLLASYRERDDAEEGAQLLLELSRAGKHDSSR